MLMQIIREILISEDLRRAICSQQLSVSLVERQSCKIQLLFQQ